jgi:hypothetical protein
LLFVQMQQARQEYEKRMALNQAQAMRSAQAQAQAQAQGQFQNAPPTHTPQTPNMNMVALTMDNGASPMTVAPGLVQGQGMVASPLNPMARNMGREASRNGNGNGNGYTSMGPPASPVSGGRSGTPKPGTAGKTPKSSKDDSVVSHLPTTQNPLADDAREIDRPLHQNP